MISFSDIQVIFEKMGDTFFWSYVITISTMYVFLAFFSYREILTYLHKNNHIYYKRILSSPLAPSISLIAPAYNEGVTIVDSIRSLLSLQYHRFEVIIVNDGSNDDSLKKVIEAYQLEPANMHYEPHFDTKLIRNVYRSKNKAFRKLIFVDKVNGGKADALNAGLNIAKNDLVACIDVDSIIEPDALLKMAKPFLEDPDHVIASGGVIRIANSSKIEGGRMIKPRLPDKLLAKFQVLEYMRAFLLGRLAWSRLNGLLIISGAFGLFRKEIMIKAGGYRTDTVGEDMELVVRMRRYMQERNRKYRVVYIPEPLCWTEAPSDLQQLGRQRSRWARGTIETLLIHKRLCFNPAYGLMGMLSYPFWMLFEWLAPIIELSGILYLFYMIFSNQLHWGIAALIFLMFISFAVSISIFALFIEEISFYKYSKKRDTLILILTALLEPFLFHPLIVTWSIKGNIDYLRGVKTWGNMARAGFSTASMIVLLLVFLP